MRILLFEPDLLDNGALRVSVDRAAHWRADGHDVRLFVVHRYGEPQDRVDVPEGLDVQFATSRYRRPSVHAPLALRAALTAARRADVVVAGRELGDGLLHAAVTARAAGKPFAVTVHSRVDRAVDSYVSPRKRRFTRWAVRHADRAVCVAAGLVPLVEALGVPSERIHVVTNGVDVPGIRDRALREPAVAVDGGRPMVVASGRLGPEKGFDLLIRAHAAALADGARPHDVVVLGEGPERASLEALARELDVADSVRMPGFVDNPHAVVARADVFVLPSRWEGYPLALVEALSLGIPTIAFDCVSGPREVLEGDRYGALVPAEDVAALGAAIGAHLADPGDLLARATAGSRTAAERHHPATVARMHLGILRALASGHGPSSSFRRGGRAVASSDG